MKFSTPQEKDLLNRLTQNTDFQHYVQKLGMDYLRAVETCLLCPPESAEVNRGHARGLHLQLRDLGVLESVENNDARTKAGEESGG